VARPGDLVLSAIVGSAGLPATIAAIEMGCDIALANKETLVAAGELVMPLVRQRGVNLLPVDSEHSAIFQCLQAGRSVNEVARLVLTASGGPFRTWPADRVENASVEQTLDHPTWDMGPKVTVDSASLMNKALEVVEAHWLFDMPADQIAVVVHPQSIVHSFVEFIDGSVVAQLSPPDMKSPIQYALSWPARLDGCARTMDWQKASSLDFEPVDHDRFPALGLAWRVIETGGTAGAIFNAANEVAVAAFLDRRTSFGMITRLVERAMNAIEAVPVQELDDIHRADQAARAEVARLLDGSLVSSNLP
jgi:1-deoxy-D-xylulose-5-phosphate reductoisomerase